MNESPREILECLARSDDRVSILATLATGASFTRAELQTETGIPRSTASRILNECLDSGLVSSVHDRYEVTPFGGFVAERLDSIFDSIEAMQRLQLLLNQLSDADPDVTFTEHPSSEILTPTSTDQRAPTRRFADLLQAASRVRLLVPSVIPVPLERDIVIGDGVRTLELVIPRVALEVARDSSVASRRLQGLMAAGTVTVFSYDGDIAHVTGTIDETAVVGLTDDTGTIQGYMETSDEAVCSWAETSIEAHQQHADRVTV